MKFAKLFVFLSLVFSLSCSSDWDQSSQSKDLVINVTAPVAVGSRADAPAAINGYNLVCIMQLLDNEGNTVGTQATAEYSDGGFSFTVKGTDRDNGATQAIFWAEYQPTASGSKKVYVTDDLRSVSYAVTDFDLSDANQIAAMEVFSGKMDDITEGSVVLRRPVAKYSFKPTGVENAKDASSLEVSYSVYGYNVYSQGSTAKQDITLKNMEFDYSSTPWFVTYMLCPTDKTYSEPVTVKFREEPVVIPSDKLPLNANYQYIITAAIGMSDVTIDVTIDDSWNDGSGDSGSDEPGGSSGEDPVTDPGDDSDEDDDQSTQSTDYQVGDMIDANGYITADESKAVAVYFQDGIKWSDNISNYPDYTGKQIKGYAIALENISETALTATVNSSHSITSNVSGTIGILNTDKLLECVSGSPFANSFNEWKSKNKILNDNITEWYIPSRAQYDYLYKACSSTSRITVETVLNGAANAVYILSSITVSSSIVKFN